MLLNLLSSDSYFNLVFYIKINYYSCDLLFYALFISLHPKHNSQIAEPNTYNNVSEFTCSNWMTKYYYLSPTHKSLLE